MMRISSSEAAQIGVPDQVVAVLVMRTVADVQSGFVQDRRRFEETGHLRLERMQRLGLIEDA